jgi:glycosyltransferase involved in cell wall biosynthesis
MKDHETFVDAMARVAAVRPNLWLVMAGRGVDPGNVRLVDAIARKGLLGRTSLCGEVADTPSLFAALDVAVSASYSEAFPNVVGEAMASGLPCVVTDAGDSARLVGSSGESGIVVPTRDPAAMAAAVTRLLELGPEERASMGVRARARIAAEFSLDRMVRRYEHLYESLGDRVVSTN